MDILKSKEIILNEVNKLFEFYQSVIEECSAKEKEWIKEKNVVTEANSRLIKEVAEKVMRHSEALGGLSRFSFQLDVAGLTHEQLMNAIELIGTKVAPIIRKKN